MPASSDMAAVDVHNLRLCGLNEYSQYWTEMDAGICTADVSASEACWSYNVPISHQT